MRQRMYNSTTSTRNDSRRKRDTGTLGVDGDDGIDPRLTLSLRPEMLRRFHSGGDGGVNER